MTAGTAVVAGLPPEGVNKFNVSTKSPHWLPAQLRWTDSFQVAVNVLQQLIANQFIRTFPGSQLRRLQKNTEDHKAYTGRLMFLLPKNRNHRVSMYMSSKRSPQVPQLLNPLLLRDKTYSKSLIPSRSWRSLLSFRQCQARLTLGPKKTNKKTTTKHILETPTRKPRRNHIKVTKATKKPLKKQKQKHQKGNPKNQRAVATAW